MNNLKKFLLGILTCGTPPNVNTNNSTVDALQCAIAGVIPMCVSHGISLSQDGWVGDAVEGGGGEKSREVHIFLYHVLCTLRINTIGNTLKQLTSSLNSRKQ